MQTRRVGTVGLILVALTPFAYLLAGEPDPIRNKEVARQFFEDVLGKGRFELADALHSPDFTVHAKNGVEDHEQNMQWARGWRQAFPDLTIEILEIVAEGDLVAVYWRGSGTNTGTGNGLPVTGKRGEGTGFTLYRFENGRIAEEWTKWGYLEMMQQLGLLECRPVTPSNSKGER